jgi:hypothetical protein
MMTMEFDLENRLDGVMESTEARGIMGISRALSAYALKVYSTPRNLWQDAEVDI